MINIPSKPDDDNGSHHSGMSSLSSDDMIINCTDDDEEEDDHNTYDSPPYHPPNNNNNNNNNNSNNNTSPRTASFNNWADTAVRTSSRSRSKRTNTLNGGGLAPLGGSAPEFNNSRITAAVQQQQLQQLPSRPAISKQNQQLLILDMRTHNNNVEDSIILQVISYLNNVRNLAEQVAAAGRKNNNDSKLSNDVVEEGRIVLNGNEINMGVQLVMDRELGGLKKSLYVTVLTGESANGLFLRSILQKLFHSRRSQYYIDDNGNFLVDALSGVRDELNHHNYTHYYAPSSCQEGEVNINRNGSPNSSEEPMAITHDMHEAMVVSRTMVGDISSAPGTSLLDSNGMMMQTLAKKGSSSDGDSLSSNLSYSDQKLPAIDTSTPPPPRDTSIDTSTASGLGAGRSNGSRRRRRSFPGEGEGSATSLFYDNPSSRQRLNPEEHPLLNHPQGTSMPAPQEPPQLSSYHHPIVRSTQSSFHPQPLVGGNGGCPIMPTSQEYPRISNEEAALRATMYARSTTATMAATIPPSRYRPPNVSIKRLVKDQEIMQRAISESQASYIAHTRQQVADDLNFQKTLEIASIASTRETGGPPTAAEQVNQEKQLILMASHRSLLDEEQRLHVAEEQYEADIKLAMEKSEYDIEEDEQSSSSSVSCGKTIFKVIRRCVSTSITNSEKIDEEKIKEAVWKSLSRKVDDNNLLAMNLPCHDDLEEMIEKSIRRSIRERDLAMEEEELIRKALEASMI